MVASLKPHTVDLAGIFSCNFKLAIIAGQSQG